jgi:hypothetical protein
MILVWAVWFAATKVLNIDDLIAHLAKCFNKKEVDFADAGEGKCKPGNHKHGFLNGLWPNYNGRSLLFFPSFSPPIFSGDEMDAEMEESAKQKKRWLGAGKKVETALSLKNAPKKALSKKDKAADSKDAATAAAAADETGSVSLDGPAEEAEEAGDKADTSKGKADGAEAPKVAAKDVAAADSDDKKTEGGGPSVSLDDFSDAEDDKGDEGDEDDGFEVKVVVGSCQVDALRRAASKKKARSKQAAAGVHGGAPPGEVTDGDDAPDRAAVALSQDLSQAGEGFGAAAAGGAASKTDLHAAKMRVMRKLSVLKGAFHMGEAQG